MKNKVFMLFLMLVLALSICGCGQSNTSTNDIASNEIEYDIAGDIENVKSIFLCVDKDTLIEKFGKNIVNGDDIQIEGSFAGIEGVYKFEFYGEGDPHEEGNIYSVDFTWDRNQEVTIDDIANEMISFLGEPSSSDAEWGNYHWFATEVNELTKFSGVPFGNSFDVDICRDAQCISFNLSTVA